MAVVQSGKLRKNAYEHPSEKGSTFFVELSESNYNFKSREKVWTNYSAGIYAKDSQADFLRNNLVEGAFITVVGNGIIVDTSFTGNDGVIRPKLEIQNASVDLISTPIEITNGAQGNYGQNQAPAAPQAPVAGGGGWDEDTIPFAGVDSRAW